MNDAEVSWAYYQDGYPLKETTDHRFDSVDTVMLIVAMLVQILNITTIRIYILRSMLMGQSYALDI